MNKLRALFLFIDLCKRNNVKLFLFISPAYQLNDSLSRYDDISIKLKNKFNLKVYNFESDSLFLMHPDFFADPMHLNIKGAKVWSGMVARLLTD
jgi:hypothetical protein